MNFQSPRLFGRFESLDDALEEAQKLRPSNKLLKVLQKSIKLCSNVQDADRVMKLMPKACVARHELLLKVCELAPDKETLVDFIVRNRIG